MFMIYEYKISKYSTSNGSRVPNTRVPGTQNLSSAYPKLKFRVLEIQAQY